MIQYVKSLINEKKKFAMGIMDIDNFKLINDNYGHHIGDVAIQLVAQSLAKAIGDKGLVGRFGGDEFIVIVYDKVEYDDIHPYMKELFHSGGFVRKHYRFEKNEIYITGTIGVATYPLDAYEYDELFEKADKALYRGKTKGRNCVICYVDAKHKDIDVSRKSHFDLYQHYDRIADILEIATPSMERVKNLLTYIRDSLAIYEAFIIDNNMNIISTNGKEKITEFTISDLEYLIGPTRVCSIAHRTDLLMLAPGIYKYGKGFNLHSFMYVRIESFGKRFGYLMFTENKIERIWQADEIALIKYVAKLLAAYIRGEDISLD